MNAIPQETTDLLAALLQDILEQIGTTANSLSHGLIALSCGNVDESQIYLFTKIAEQIGYLADLGITHISGAPDIVGGAEQWMLPPSYMELKERLATQSGDGVPTETS